MGRSEPSVSSVKAISIDSHINLQEKARFVQIAVAIAPQQANLISGRDDLGGVWCCRDTNLPLDTFTSRLPARLGQVTFAPPNALTSSRELDP